MSSTSYIHLYFISHQLNSAAKKQSESRLLWAITVGITSGHLNFEYKNESSGVSIRRNYYLCSIR